MSASSLQTFPRRLFRATGPVDLHYASGSGLMTLPSRVLAQDGNHSLSVSQILDVSNFDGKQWLGSGCLKGDPKPYFQQTSGSRYLVAIRKYHLHFSLVDGGCTNHGVCSLYAHRSLMVQEGKLKF